MKTFLIITLMILAFTGCNSLQNFDSSNQYESEDPVILVNKPIWIYRNTGIQCQKTYYPTLIESVEQLERFHIEVMDFKKTHQIEHCACGYPSGLIYIAQIRYSDLDNAIALGWKFYKNEINK